MNVIVTGGAGFVGSNLCLELTRQGHKVLSIDNYFTGSEKNHHDGVEYIKDCSSNIAKYNYFNPQIVYHLGEYSRVEQSFDDIELVWEYNRVPITNVIKYCSRNNVKLIYSGSSTKFGDDGLGKNQSPYAWSKFTNTELIINYGNWFNLNYAITYFYNVYGNNEINDGKYATVIGIFKKCFLDGKTINIVKPGTQERNFTHIDDVVSALILIGFKGKGDGYGIGHSKKFTIEEIANIFPSEKNYISERKGNRMNAKVVTSKTVSLGWNAKIDLKEHLLEFIENTIKSKNNEF